MMSYYTRKLLIGTLGIYLSYISLGYLAEKLFNTHFAIASTTEKEVFQKFKFPSLVTWVGCLLCSIYGLIYAKFRDSKPNLIPLKERVRLGLLFTLNYLPTNYALLYISYPLQVVAKNSRYILVVIVGVFFSRVSKSKQLRLPRSKLLIGILITFGAGLFMFYETRKEVKHFDLDPTKRWIGYALLLIAIICDALFSDSQAYCKANFKPTPNQLFLASNLYGFALIFLFSLISGELQPSLLFCMRHPIVILHLLAIGILQVLGQVSVYYVISNFKQHIYPLISTTRKIITILVSIVVFQHSLNRDQWFALSIVFLSMAYELYDEVSSQEHHRHAKKLKAQRSSNQGSEQMSKITHDEGQLPHGSNIQTIQPVRKSSASSINSVSSKGSNKAGNKPMRGSRSKQVEHLNRFISSALGSQQREDESLSKYRYNWRIGEIVQNRQTTLTPDKKDQHA